MVGHVDKYYKVIVRHIHTECSGICDLILENHEVLMSHFSTQILIIFLCT